MRIDARSGPFAMCCADLDRTLILQDLSEIHMVLEADNAEPSVEVKLEDCSEHVQLVDKEPVLGSVSRTYRFSAVDRTLFPKKVCIAALDSPVGTNTVRLRHIEVH